MSLLDRPTEASNAADNGEDDLGEMYYHKLLDQMFGSCTWRRQGNHDRVLEILQKHPSLASRRFSACYNHGIMPLTCLLLSFHSASSTLETIQVVYDLYPNAAVELQGAQMETALHAACRNAQDSESNEMVSVVEFIYKANPAALLVRDRYGRNPLDILFWLLGSSGYADLGYADLQQQQRQQVFGLFKRLIALSPTILRHQSGCNYLVDVFKYGYLLDTAVIDFIVETCLRQNDGIVETFHVSSALRGLNAKRAHMVKLFFTKILPNVRSLALCEHSCFSFSEESTQLLLLEKLAGNGVIQRLKWSLQRPGRDFELLEEILAATTKTLVSVEIISYDDEDQIPTDSYEETEVLRTLIDTTASPGSALREVELTRFRFQRILSSPLSCASLTVSKLRKLCLTNCDIYCEHLLTIPSLFPHLEELSVNSPHFIDSKPLRRVDITAPVVSHVDGSSQMTHLKSLYLTGSFALKTELVCDALRHNTFIKKLALEGAFSQEKKQNHLLTILREKNTTLEEVVSPSFGMNAEKTESYIQLQYLLRLNKWGRRIARDAGAGRDALGRSLCKVSQATTDQLSEDDKCCTLFGLLREVPSHWVDN